jgi:anti-sigma factor RsiW
MNTNANHIPKEILERYALKRYALNTLSSQETGQLEEHLLICQRCRTNLEELDEFVAVMRAALAASSPNPPAVSRKKRAHAFSA